MASGSTAQAAVDNWRQNYMGAFGAGTEIFPAPSNPSNIVGQQTGIGSKTVFRYEQCTDGNVSDGVCAPNCFVDTHGARFVVRQVNESCFQVVHAAAVLSPPTVQCPPASIDGATALNEISNHRDYDHLPNWAIKGLMVYYGGPGTTPVRTWKIAGWDLSIPEAYYFYVHAENATLVAVRDDVFDAGSVSGTVKGRYTPGLRPDIPSGQPVSANPPGPPSPLSYLRVQLDPTNTCPTAECPDILCDTDWGITNTAGQFTIPYTGGPATASVTASLQGFCPLTEDNGPPWVHVHNCLTNIDGNGNCLACPLLPSTPSTGCVLNVTPLGNPNVGDIVFNIIPTGYATAQVNSFVHTTRIHELYKQYQPFFTGLDQSLVIQTNVTDGDEGCGAGFSGESSGYSRLAFWSAGIDPIRPELYCYNAAFSSIIAHEFGHFIVQEIRPLFTKGGGATASFNEGFADAFALLADNHPVIGPDWCNRNGSVGAMRDYGNADCNGCPRVSYPPQPQINFCGGENCFVHAPWYWEGKLLAGTWWDIRLNLPLDGQGSPHIARKLFTDWSQITIGEEPVSGAPAHPLTAIEVLVADDDDGDFTNGTPNACAICDAFLKHNIDCPPMWDCNANRVPDQCEATITEGARYLKTSVNCANSPVALRVRGLSSNLTCLDRYVKPDGTLGAPAPDPADDRRTPSQWGTVAIHDTEVIPSVSAAQRSQYEISKEYAGGSQVLAILETPIWGNVIDVPNGSPDLVDVDDILCMLDGFGGCFTTCKFRALDLMPCDNALPVEQRVIDVDDLLALLDAYLGVPYPCGTQCTSPMMTSEGTKPATGSFRLSTASAAGPDGVTMDVDVFISAVPELRCIQVQLESSDGKNAPLVLQNAVVAEDALDYVFADRRSYSAVDRNHSRAVACLLSGAVDATSERYFGRFTFVASADATGVTIDISAKGTHLRGPQGEVLEFQSAE